MDDLGRPPPFRMGVNQFSDMTPEEFAAERFGGVKLPNRLKRKLEHKKLRGTSMKKIDEDGEVEEEDIEYQDDDWSLSGEYAHFKMDDLPEYKNWAEEGYVTTPYD